MSYLFSSIKESVSSVMPIALIVSILFVTCVPLDAGVLVMFFVRHCIVAMIAMTPLITIQIMEDVNKEFGITSPANGIMVSVPTEKAYKI